MVREDRTPGWVYVIAGALALVQPLSHAWLAAFTSETVVHSGLGNADSAIYLHAMRMFDNGFFSAYATCQAPNGPNDVGFFPLPFHWLYGIVGAGGRIAGVDPFLFLGWANGAFTAIYLLVAYRFLRRVAPVQANLAFVLFTLAGGLGGVLYVASGLLGYHNSAQFDDHFWRFAMYELVEGPYLSPLHHGARLYYTTSLALCLGALTALMTSMETRCTRHFVFAGVLLFAGSVVNVRLGGLAWAVALIYLVGDTRPERAVRVRGGILFSMALATSFGVVWAMLQMNPSFARNTAVLVRENMWPTAFLSVAFFHLPLLPAAIGVKLAGLNRGLFVATWAALGYLAAFMLLFVAHQVYFGTFFAAGDTAAAVMVSDSALIGAAWGALFAWRRSPAAAVPNEKTAWVATWFVIFLAIAVSAWGQGWLLRLTPQRLMLFLGLPLSILSAWTLQELGKSRRSVARLYTSLLVGCGVVSMIVGVLYFQGPLGREPGKGPFAYLHPEIMTRAEGPLLEGLDEGIVLAPWNFSDVIALRPGLRVLGGVGSTDLSDAMSIVLEPQIAAFFSAETEMDREAFVEAWCIDYVYCPDTWPVEAGTLARFGQARWLAIVEETTRGAVFRVIEP